IQAVALGEVRRLLRVRRVGDAEQGVLAQAHNPAQQQMAAGGERRLGEGGGEIVDTSLQRRYHTPHGRISFLAVVAALRLGGPSLFVTSSARAGPRGKHSRNLRKSSEGSPGQSSTSPRAERPGWCCGSCSGRKGRRRASRGQPSGGRSPCRTGTAGQP